MKRILIALSILALSLTPALAAWQTQAAVNAGYVAQKVEQAGGEDATEYSPTVMSGIQFYRAGSLFGLSIGVATLPDEEQTTPRIAPYGALHLGSADAQFFIGAAYDPQNGGGNDLVLTLGGTFAFGASQ